MGSISTEASRRAIMLGAAGTLLAAPTLAQPGYPDKPIRLVVPYGGGGQTDIVSRVTAEAMSHRLGQPVVADNRPGGAGNTAAEAVARAAPDGYTMLVATMGTNSGLNALMYRSVGYDAARDFTGVGMFCTTSNLLIVHNSIPGANFAEVVAWIRANPGKFNYASAGVGAITHIIMEDIGARLNLDMVHVPYRQTTNAMTDLMAGRVHARCLGLPEGEPLRSVTSVRPIAVTTPLPRPEWPGVGTVAEVIPGFEASTYFGLAVPARTPAPIVTRLNDALQAALRDPEVRAAYARVGADPADPHPPEVFAERAKRDGERWAPLIRRLNLVAE
ncbi:tripartite tricarboxylate transporter substrate binding protein [Roseomonas sp. CAU 1739]|uniref:Bug family tripartite tricarboxylate transporter substrate binding protein n=1 Tax=Roseomonas sp. CAU 1739 TaxID=3140364 RepID=UPI00325B5562